MSGELNERSRRLRAKIDHSIRPPGVVFHACRVARGVGFAFVPIARAGSTSVKTAILQQMGRLPGGVIAVHNALGYHPNGTTCLSPRQARELDGHTTFAVYRDPVERLGSIRRWFVANSFGHRRWHGLRDEAGPYDYDFVLDLVRAELAGGRVEDIDQHVRPQMMTHDAAGPLDWIVPLPHLAEFMRSRLGVEIPHRHTTTSIDDDGPDAAQVTEIHRLYADDFRIPDRFSDRLYLP